MSDCLKCSYTRKLNDLEMMMYKAILKNFLIIRYTIQMASKKPLKTEDVKASLVHLQRKVPTLRLCFKKKENGEIWFIERKDQEIDFKVGEKRDYEKEKEELLYKNFDNFSGPLWRCRLFPCPPDASCPIPEMKKDFPYQYNLLLCFHHTITDGTSNIKICNYFLQILNDVIGGIAINDEEQLGYHITEQQNEELLKDIEKELKKNDDELKGLINMHYSIENLDLPLIKAYPSNSPDVARTKTIQKQLTINETDALIKKCKSEGVKVNSLICAAINAAIVQLLKRAGIKEEMYIVPFQNLVNSRRYLKYLNGNPLGITVQPLTTISKVPNNIKDNFWKYAKSLNNEIQHQLSQKQALKEIIASDFHSSNDIEKLLSDDINEFLKYPYVTSNLGLLEFTGTGKYVQATHLIRNSSLQKLVSMHYTHTFRGRLMYGLDYGTEYLSDEGAQLWSEAVFKILLDQIKN